MTLAQLARAGTALGRRVEPHGEVTCVERERRSRRSTAPGPCAKASHKRTVTPFG
jgi:hypothetical protein